MAKRDGWLQCPECGWWLKPGEAVCFDCDRPRNPARLPPARKPSSGRSQVLTDALFLGVPAGLVTALVVAGSTSSFSGFGASVAILSAVYVLAFAAIGEASRIVLVRRSNAARASLLADRLGGPAIPLRVESEQLEQHAEELAARLTALAGLRRDVAARMATSESPSAREQRLHEALRATQEASALCRRQLERCEATRGRFALVRWRNAFEGCLRSLAETDRAALAQLADDAAHRQAALAAGPLASTEAGEALLRDWQQALADCGRAQDDVLTYAALEALRGIRPLTDDEAQTAAVEHLSEIDQPSYLGALESELRLLDDERARMADEAGAVAAVADLLKQQ